MLNNEKFKFLINIFKNNENLTDKEDILNKLYEIRLNLIDEKISKNKEYFNTIKQVYILYEQIEKNVQEEQNMNLIDDWMCLKNEMNECENEIYYKTGIKDGINIFLTAIEDFNENEV